PIGHLQVCSVSVRIVACRLIGTTTSSRLAGRATRRGSGAIWPSGFSAVLPATIGRTGLGRPVVAERAPLLVAGLRARATGVEAGLARPERLSRCTLPMTALRVTPPNSEAIWLALKPSVQSFFSNSTRSSVQVISVSLSVGAIPGILSPSPAGMRDDCERLTKVRGKVPARYFVS